MQIPELLHSLTLAGLSLATEPDGRLSVIGPVEKLTVEQRQALKKNAEPLKDMLTTPTCFELEQAEREAIQWADSNKDQGLGERVGNKFLEMATQDYRPWFERRIGELETLESLDSFGQRFENDILEFEVFRPIADDIRELLGNRRALLVEREPHNQKTSEPGAVTPDPL